MTIISLIKTNGTHSIQSQSHRDAVWLEGYIEVPDALTAKAFATAGYCDLVIENGVLTDIVPLPPPEAPPLPPAEQRRIAYETERMIEWEGAMRTVTEMGAVWTYYMAEGNPIKADEVQQLIMSAKFAIRERFPDDPIDN